MNDVLRNFSESDIRAFIEANPYAYLEHFGQTSQIQMHDTGDVQYLVTDIPIKMLNSIFRVRLGRKTIDARLDDIITRYTARQLPMIWWLGPSTQPPDLPAYLQAQGLQEVGVMQRTGFLPNRFPSI